MNSKKNPLPGKLYDAFDEKLYSIKEVINNTDQEIQKTLKIQILNFTTEIEKIYKNLEKTSKIKNKTNNLIIKTSFWIPRKHREAIVGDIMEDCHELRALGKSEWRIRIHIIWHVVLTLRLLQPTTLMDAFKRIWSIK